MLNKGGPQIATVLKFSFSKISFPLKFPFIKRCILLDGCYGKRGGVLHPEGGMLDDAIALTGSERAWWRLH